MKDVLVKELGVIVSVVAGVLAGNFIAVDEHDVIVQEVEERYAIEVEALKQDRDNLAAELDRTRVDMETLAGYVELTSEIPTAHSDMVGRALAQELVTYMESTGSLHCDENAVTLMWGLECP